MIDDPAKVATELRRRGLPVVRGSDLIGSDAALREAVRLARVGGRETGELLRPKHINRGRLIEAGKQDCPDCPHDQRQHNDFTGCTWTEPDGSDPCPCTRRYMDLGPRRKGWLS